MFGIVFTMFFSVILIGVLTVAFLGPETRLRELVDE